MKKHAKLPTVLGIIILLVGMVAGIYLINSKQNFKLSANIEATPKNIRFSNITNSSVTVSWTTDIESSGFVKWGNNENLLSKVALEENDTKSYVHSVNVIGTPENSNVYLKISSEGKDYDNNGVVWQTKTITAQNNLLTSSSTTAAGSVLFQDTGKPAKSVVYLTINGILLSGLTSNEGNFVIPISLYTGNLSDTTVIEINVNAGIKGTSQAVIYPKAIKAIPTLFIGKTYDFRSLNVSDSNNLPESSLSIPEAVTISSRFEVQKTESSGNNVVTIESIDDGEIVTTTNPDFFGKGPKNTTIEISVQSELQQTTITPDGSGKWSWSPPANLEVGEHTVTLKWRDASGILRTITRNFVVQAADGPAFESTPSASPITLTTSTPIATPGVATTSPTSKSTPVVTTPPVPETGDLTPTIGLFIMGMGVLMSSVFVWNKSNV